MYLFVYGTLKRGYHNNVYLTGQKFVGEAETEPCYRLFDNGLFPMLVEDEDGYSVSGELWRVTREATLEIDLHERLYNRRVVQIADPPTDRPIFAYIYKEKIDDSLYECDCGVWP